jgi:hypothetical protein
MTVAALAIVCLCACVGSSSQASKESSSFTSVCELAKGGAALDGRLVKFRSEWELGVEFARVVDSRCPRINLFLRHDSSLDLTLCSETGMRFGCPVDPYLKVKATFTGVFHAWNSNGGSVEVVSMTDVSSDSGLK